MPDFHPFLVSFPIVLIVLVFSLEMYAKLKRDQSVSSFNFILLAVLVLSVFFAYFSGNYASSLITGKLYELHNPKIDFHHLLATVTLFLVIIPLVFKLSLKSNPKQALEVIYWLSLILVLISILTTGYFGGSLVFDHGVGVNLANQSTSE